MLWDPPLPPTIDERDRASAENFGHEIQDMLGNGRCGSESGGFDAHQLNDTRKLRVSLNDEVRKTFFTVAARRS